MPDDASVLYDCWHDPDVQKNLNSRETESPLEDWWISEEKRPRSWLRCVVVSLDTGGPAGMVSLGSVAADPELIVLLLPQFRGRGLGVEAARLIVDYGFAMMGLAGIGAGAFDFNKASQKMLDRLGFTRTPAKDESRPNRWGPGNRAELAYHLDRAAWERNRATADPVRPSVFDARGALDTIRKLDFVRLCGSQGERRGMDHIAERLDEIGVTWRHHTFHDWWMEPEDPHLAVRGRKLAVRPVMEFSFQYGFDFVTDNGLLVDVSAPLSPAGGPAGTITVSRRFDPEQPVRQDAAAQLLAMPFDPEAEAYLWSQPTETQQVPAAYVGLEDAPFVLDALGEPAVLRWGTKRVRRKFRNLVAEIPGAVRPKEIVVLGAHIDSFPGTVGSSDDGAGCALLVEAARWFAANPPARTVRLVWFTGEELDRRGSRSYVEKCVTDPAAVKLMVNVDTGCEMYTGPARVYVLNDETVEWVRERFNLQGIEVYTSESAYSDAGAFSAAGIRTFTACGPSKQSAHLPDDRPESIDPHKLQLLGSLNLEAAIRAACESMANLTTRASGP